jgi:hypothetical protein
MDDEKAPAAGEHSLDATETWGQGRDQSHSEGLAGALGPETRGGSGSGPETTDDTPDGLGGLRQEPPQPAPPRIEDQPEGQTMDVGSDTGFGRPER